MSKPTSLPVLDITVTVEDAAWSQACDDVAARVEAAVSAAIIAARAHRRLGRRGLAGNPAACPRAGAVFIVRRRRFGSNGLLSSLPCRLVSLAGVALMNGLA